MQNKKEKLERIAFLWNKHCLGFRIVIMASKTILKNCF